MRSFFDRLLCGNVAEPKGTDMSRSIVELATEVQNARNAVNVSGLAQSFAKAMVDLGAHTNERNTHFITRAWISVLAEKSGTDPSSEVPWLQVDSVRNGNGTALDLAPGCSKCDRVGWRCRSCVTAKGFYAET